MREGISTLLSAYSASGSDLEAPITKNLAFGKAKEPENAFVSSENNEVAEETLGGVRPCGCALQSEVNALKRREEVLVSWDDDVLQFCSDVRFWSFLKVLNAPS